MKDIRIAVAVDVDAVCGWIGSFGGADSPQAISRGLFAGEVGVPRLLTLLERLDITATWFMPGHSIETFPAQMKSVVEKGHEVALHGYSHENPKSLTAEQEETILRKSLQLVTGLAGRHPAGYSAPWWEPSENTIDLLEKYNIKYDHSMGHRDFEAYRLRRGDSWVPIDYSQAAETWMKPLVRGTESSIVEIPGNWYLDDLPPMMWIPSFPNSHGWVNPRDIGQQWIDQFDWVYSELDSAVFPLTIHPDVSGRPQVLMMLREFFQHVSSRSGVRFCTLEQAADEFIQNEHGGAAGSQHDR